MDHSYMLELNTPSEEKLTENQLSSELLDLSNKGFKKLPKPEDAQHVKELILDDNALQKIDNIDSFLRIEKLSLCRNKMLRMYGVNRLHMLQELHLANNCILTIEGLKELVQLRHLDLHGNNIKTVEHLNTNQQLEYLNLSENGIGNLTDISMLKKLKELHLHGNRLTHLRQCDRNLPTSIQTLTLDHNNISDLNEICTLAGLTSLNSISIQDNPCVEMTNSPFIYKNSGFDYRPFVLNWCMTVKIIDGFAVNPIESLKAEWLYSQGRGRQFRVGEQDELAKYLSSVCPLTGQALENEEDRKLRLILSKAQQHQRQLKEEISEHTSSSANNSPSNRRRGGNRIQSPRVSRLGRASSNSPDAMSSSYHGITSSTISSEASSMLQMSTSLIENVHSDHSSLMAQSMDSSMLSSSTTKSSSEPSSVRSVIPPLNDHQARQSSPLVAASKMVPVPESLMSPDCPPLTVSQQNALSSTPIQSASFQSHKMSTPKPTKESKLVTPKVNRTSVTKKQEKSPILSARKSNSNSINTALKTNQNQSQLHHPNDTQIQRKSITMQSKSPPPASFAKQQQQQQQLQYQHHHQQTQQNQQQHPQQKQNNNSLVTPDNASVVSSDDDSDHINVDKLKTIHNQAAHKSQAQSNYSKDKVDTPAADNRLQKQNSTEESAILIQKIWRGYNTRKMNKCIAETLQQSRTQQHIEKLSQDMETTKVALENERKIQQLQMQAINALWKKVSTLQPPTAAEIVPPPVVIPPDNNSTAVVQDLAKTCTMLTNQVQQLQGSMRDIIQCMSVLCKLPNNQDASTGSEAETTKPEVRDSCSTQTEIIAVHTPQVENLPLFPFKMTRPSTLSLTDTNDSNTSTRKLSDNNGSEQTDCEQRLTENDGESSTSKRDETPELSGKSEHKSDAAEQTEN